MNWIEPDWPAPGNVRALSTTRDGGLSEGVFAGLNLGAHVWDEPARVEANRARLQQAAQIPGPLNCLNQVPVPYTLLTMPMTYSAYIWVVAVH